MTIKKSFNAWIAILVIALLSQVPRAQAQAQDQNPGSAAVAGA